MAPRLDPLASPAIDAGAAGRLDWLPIGGAFTASIVLHALLLGAVVALLVNPDSRAGDRPAPVALSAVLTQALTVATTSSSRAEPRPTVDEFPRPVAQVPAVAPPGGADVPWSGSAIDTAPPVSMTGRARVADGVEFVETRSVATLGEDIERRIQRDFPDEADLPLRLRPATSIGYPLDALAAGIEGRVLVWFGVDEDGKVVDRAALDGPQELRDWVLERLDLLIEKPARTLQDRGVRSWMALEVFFDRERAEDGRARLAREAGDTALSAAK